VDKVHESIEVGLRGNEASARRGVDRDEDRKAIVRSGAGRMKLIVRGAAGRMSHCGWMAIFRCGLGQ
jgi:D-arabinose 5-phosphate isomerase GutQ